MTETPSRSARWIRRAAGRHPRLFSRTYRFWQALMPALILATPNLIWAAAHSHAGFVVGGMFAAVVLSAWGVAIGVSVIHLDKIDELVPPMLFGLLGAAVPIAVVFAVSVVEDQQQQPLWTVVVSIFAATWAAYWFAAWPSHEEVAKACYAHAASSNSENVRDTKQTTNEGGDAR